MPTFNVTLSAEFGESDTTEVVAEYSVIEDGFITFKSDDHKQIALFNAREVRSIVRSDTRPAIIGSVTVNVVPQIDEDAFGEAVETAVARIEKRIAARSGG